MRVRTRASTPASCRIVVVGVFDHVSGHASPTFAASYRVTSAEFRGLRARMRRRGALGVALSLGVGVGRGVADGVSVGLAAGVPIGESVAVGVVLPGSVGLTGGVAVGVGAGSHFCITNARKFSSG